MMHGPANVKQPYVFNIKNNKSSKQAYVPQT
jgi:hypothetical protein